jgi:hypothetical protein
VDEWCTSQVHAQAGCWQRSLREDGGWRWKACTHAGCPQIGVRFDRDAGAARAIARCGISALTGCPRPAELTRS